MLKQFHQFKFLVRGHHLSTARVALAGLQGWLKKECSGPSHFLLRYHLLFFCCYFSCSALSRASNSASLMFSNFIVLPFG